MSRTIFRDVEEAISREVRRITFHDSRTVDRIVLQDTFDPLTGELVQIPVEADYYDSSADTKNIQYPHFFVKILKTKEDLTTGRVVPQYGRWCAVPVKTTPRAFEIVASSSDGTISVPGNDLNTSLFQIRKVEPGFFLRLINGNNVGTYIVDSINVSNTGTHTITVSQDLSLDLPSVSFDVTTRSVVFSESVDLNTVAVGDNYVDNSSVAHPITAVDINSNLVVIGGVATPDTDAGGKFARVGNVFQSADPSLVRFLILDPSKPVKAPGIGESEDSNSSFSGVSPEVPVDAYYLIRIDSKERDTHVDVLNRMWEEFNPPRRGLPVIRRTALSAEELLTADVTSGGSQTVTVANNADFNINDSVFIFDNLIPTTNSAGEFSRPFESKIIGKNGTTELILEDTVPDTYVTENEAIIVSNGEFRIYMFNFVSHDTRDLEGAQYWVHEFVFWVQVWVDRNEEPLTTGVVQDVQTPIEDFDNNIIIEDC